MTLHIHDPVFESCIQRLLSVFCFLTSSRPVWSGAGVSEPLKAAEILWEFGLPSLFHLLLLGWRVKQWRTRLEAAAWWICILSFPPWSCRSWMSGEPGGALALEGDLVQKITGPETGHAPEPSTPVSFSPAPPSTREGHSNLFLLITSLWASHSPTPVLVSRHCSSSHLQESLLWDPSDWQLWASI